MRILCIHGRSQGGKDPKELKEIWIETLKKGFKANGIKLPENLVFDFPFYGDILDELTSQHRMGNPSEVLARGADQSTDYQEFMRSAIQEIKQRKEISDIDIVAESDNVGIKEKGIQNWEWVQAIVKYIDNHCVDVSEFTIEQFLTDVYLYINIDQVTEKINKIVEDKLTDEPTIVVGHSLGSIVAYKVIMNNLNTINLRKFITVGSPLGIKAISSKLGIPKNPVGKDGWYNAYDEGDIVALNPLDEKYFPTTPKISNYNQVTNHTENQHGIIGYLNDKHVANEIAKAL